MVTPPWPTSSSVVGCFPSTFTRSSSIFFYLKIVGNVIEIVEQFKEIGISPITKASEPITSSTLLIDSISSIAFLPNFVFSKLGTIPSFTFYNSMASSFWISTGTSTSCLLLVALCLCILLFWVLNSLWGNFLWYTTCHL